MKWEKCDGVRVAADNVSRTSRGEWRPQAWERRLGGRHEVDARIGTPKAKAKRSEVSSRHDVSTCYPIPIMRAHVWNGETALASSVLWSVFVVSV